MKKNLIAVSLLLALCGASAQAGKQISSFKEIAIASGESTEIGGQMQSEPDIYYVSQPDGTYEAVRLTVTPPPGAAEITQPYLNNNTPSSVCVNWKTNKKATEAVVRYGLSPDKLDLTCEPSNRFLSRSYQWYTAQLTGLSPDTPYYYQVSCNGEDSPVYRFRTMPAAGTGSKIRVLFIGDHQRNERSDYEWLLNAAKRKAAEKYGDAPFEDNIHFLMNDGDQVDRGDPSLYENVHLYKSRFVSPFIANMTTVGNHEYKNDDSLKYYDLHYNSYGQIEYRGIKSGTCGYYAYQAGGVLFVVLNSDNTSAEQKMWVRKVIAAASTDETVDFIVSVQHRPLYAEQYSNDVSPWMLNEIMPILSSTPKHVLNCAGHHHLYARGQMTDTPVYHIISGGGVGTSAEGYEQLWGHTPDNRNHDEVQKTIDHWTYQIFEFDSATKQMTAETYSIGNSRLALDNELVDRFTRNVGEVEAPATPAFTPVEGNVTLPFTFTQAEKPADLYSVQYQISETEQFDAPVVNRLINAEDCYGADDKFMPLDLNKGLNLAELTVGEGSLSNGNYYIRVRNRNSNLDWSEYSAPMMFTVEGAAERGSVAPSGRFIRSGAPMSISYAGSPVGTSAWVGIYREGHTPGTADLSVDYCYTTGESGTWECNTPAPGCYFAVLFKDSGYTEISHREYFTVSDNCDDSNLPLIATDKSVYAVGDPVVVNLTNAPCLNNDWVGLYSTGAVPVSGKSHSYDYVGTNPGSSVTLNVPGNKNYTTPVGNGVYYVSYFYTDGYYEPVERVYIIVGKPVVIDTDKTIYLPTDEIRLVYDGAPEREGNRVMVYSGETLHSEIPVATAATGGSVEFGPLPSGSYELCMATADGNEISERKAITVDKLNAIAAAEAEGNVAVSVSGNTIAVSCPDGIDSVKVVALDATVAASYSPAGATAITVAPSVAPGIYFVIVNNSCVKKVILK